jgi:predicted ribosome quality control (RQC) complex YloA/Tae2 family protein
MQQQLIQEIVEELSQKLTGRFLGKIFQLTPLSFALDFGLNGGKFLFVSVDPSSPRLYIIERRAKELEKQAVHLSHFGQLMRAKVSGGKLVAISKDPSDRVVRLTFSTEDELGGDREARIVIQLTGRAANLFLLDESDRITDVLRSPKGPGQQPGEQYQPPGPQEKRHSPDKTRADGERGAGSVGPRGALSPSAAVAEFFAKLDAENSFRSHAHNVKSRLQKALTQKRRLRTNLQKDLVGHGDAETHRMLGDLLLANVTTAVRDGVKVRITDYYSEGAPTIELEIDENSSIQDEAAREFRQYTKAKRAGEELAERLTRIEQEIVELEQRELELDRIILAGDLTALASFDKAQGAPKRSRTKEEDANRIPGVRRYVSSDGYEILVGRAARDNDHLTFKLARPHDLWLHAGDYPGSHVIVRNPTRKELPQRTVIEAAQLAGYFSQASDDSKVVVHYTERKFLSKPKGAVPGLVRMSSFRSLTVEPKESISRL